DVVVRATVPEEHGAPTRDLAGDRTRPGVVAGRDVLDRTRRVGQLDLLDLVAAPAQQAHLALAQREQEEVLVPGEQPQQVREHRMVTDRREGGHGGWHAEGTRAARPEEYREPVAHVLPLERVVMQLPRGSEQ